MKAYSLDLRQKIIDVYEQEEISQRQLAKRFKAIAYAHSQISLKDIRNWFAHSCYCISPF